ncbi:MAG: hypothetical protein AAF732_23400, partial [Pseudomonadota bacterium]
SAIEDSSLTAIPRCVLFSLTGCSGLRPGPPRGRRDAPGRVRGLGCQTAGPRSLFIAHRLFQLEVVFAG